MDIVAGFECKVKAGQTESARKTLKLPFLGLQAKHPNRPDELDGTWTSSSRPWFLLSGVATSAAL